MREREKERERERERERETGLRLWIMMNVNECPLFIPSDQFCHKIPTFHVLTLAVVDRGETGPRADLGLVLSLKDKCVLLWLSPVLILYIGKLVNESLEKIISLNVIRQLRPALDIITTDKVTAEIPVFRVLL